MQGKHGRREQPHEQERADARRRHTKGPDGAPWIGVRDNADEWKRIRPAYDYRYLTEAFCLANQDDHFGVDDPVGRFVTTRCRGVDGGLKRTGDLIKAFESLCTNRYLPYKSESDCMMTALDASYVTKPDDGYDRLVPLIPTNAADMAAIGCGVSLNNAKDFLEHGGFSKVNGPSEVFVAATGAGFTVDEASCLAMRSTTSSP
ncbi:hypothetical protein pmac_cds_673 [Pandoravirus macleodensis]|uniref:Uncharacterized protein n=1 Tax=Pandoravirus macleodensis TaxID=2107707 RepID=A0A2U7UH99_9VIRU|nr:hypothetical protein pmac_cds_673 [Pandoravirus macleodensis]AVK77361.1 hypothetical protein pmac_cds_673 [Pandoravirus macleodensis]